jgi:hypothetical protein
VLFNYHRTTSLVILSFQFRACSATTKNLTVVQMGTRERVEELGVFQKEGCGTPRVGIVVCISCCSIHYLFL